jgi:hypothetical protein
VGVLESKMGDSHGAAQSLTLSTERAKVRKAMESTLLATVMKIVTYVNTHKDHIPPITTTESNPFPYQIHINQKEAGWATRMGIY